jgi:hypothetical protein
MSTQHKPNVLIFGKHRPSVRPRRCSNSGVAYALSSCTGGLNSIVGPLIDHLIPPAPAEPLVGHIRITDKFSIHPATTYIPKSVSNALEQRKNLVEYRQGNVTNEGWPKLRHSSDDRTN